MYNNLSGWNLADANDRFMMQTGPTNKITNEQKELHNKITNEQKD